jgi:hypothetical protein
VGLGGGREREGGEEDYRAKVHACGLHAGVMRARSRAAI